MFFPFLSEPPRRLFRRKGGGGGGGRGGGSSKGSSSGKSSTSSKSSSSSSKSGSISKGKTSTSGSSYSSPRVIPAGQPFAGRTEGGASRAQIFGTRAYGSGYPGLGGRGVTGRGFPFFYWPIVWPIAVGGSAAAVLYLHSEQEYGSPTNSTRPGGALAYATFPSSSTSPPTVVFRLLADNATVISLISDLTANCTTFLSNSSSPPNNLSTTSTPYTSPYTFSNVTGPANPQPEQVIQYYRASTLALTLDSYNNTATYAGEGTPDAPLPALGTRDAALLECLNTTIGSKAPMVSSGRSTANLDIPFPAFFVFWLVWWLWALI